MYVSGKRALSQYHGYEVSELQAYENLSNAVIEQAISDMAEAVFKIESGHKQIDKYEQQFAEVERFFKSDWVRDLTSVDPNLLREVAIQQGQYMMWKSDRGCSKCKLARSGKCNHGKGGVANWYAWSKGDHCCPRKLNWNKRSKLNETDGDANG